MNPKYGGISQAIRNYEFGLKNSKIHRDVVCFDTPKDARHWTEEGSLNLIALGEVKNIWQYHPKFRLWLLNNMTQYDSVIIHGLWLFHSYMTIKVLTILKSKETKAPKVFVMPHGMLDPWFQKDTSRRLKAIRNSIYWHLIEKKVINNANGLLFTCQDELELAKTTFNGYHPKKAINIGLGIAPPPIHTKEMEYAFNTHYPSRGVEVNNLSKRKPYLLFLSRIHPKKGLDLLLDAYKQILESNKKYTMPLPELVIAGPGIDTAYGKDMLKKVNESEVLKQRVHFVGMVSGDSKWGALYGCEAFILSSHQENFGIAVAEALSCGKPVLISNQVNIWKEIDSCGAGIVNEDSVKGTVKSLETFLSLSKADLDNMKSQAIFAYKQFFDVQVTADNLIKAIS